MPVRFPQHRAGVIPVLLSRLDGINTDSLAYYKYYIEEQGVNIFSVNETVCSHMQKYARAHCLNTSVNRSLN